MKCQGESKTTRQACRMQALKGDRYCFTHSPATRQAQTVARKLGGYNSSTAHAGDSAKVIGEPRTIEQAFTILDYALAETLEADNSTQRNRALIAIHAGYVDAIKQGEIENQLKELLAVLKTREGK